MQPAVSVVSPDGDGVADRQSLRYKLVRPSTATVTLTAPDGTVAYERDRAKRAGELRRRVPAAATRRRPPPVAAADAAPVRRP